MGKWWGHAGVEKDEKVTVSVNQGKGGRFGEKGSLGEGGVLFGNFVDIVTSFGRHTAGSHF